MWNRREILPVRRANMFYEIWIVDLRWLPGKTIFILFYLQNTRVLIGCINYGLCPHLASYVIHGNYYHQKYGCSLICIIRNILFNYFLLCPFHIPLVPTVKDEDRVCPRTDWINSKEHCSGTTTVFSNILNRADRKANKKG